MLLLTIAIIVSILVILIIYMTVSRYNTCGKKTHKKSKSSASVDSICEEEDCDDNSCTLNKSNEISSISYCGEKDDTADEEPSYVPTDNLYYEELSIAKQLRSPNGIQNITPVLAEATSVTKSPYISDVKACNDDRALPSDKLRSRRKKMFNTDGRIHRPNNYDRVASYLGTPLGDNERYNGLYGSVMSVANDGLDANHCRLTRHRLPDRRNYKHSFAELDGYTDR